MALIRCREYGKEISDKASVCPNCGFKSGKFVKKKRRNKIFIVLISIFVIALVISVSKAMINRMVERAKPVEGVAKQETQENIETTPNINVFFDATQFIVGETTVTEEQLVEILGEPESVEDWNHDFNEKTFAVHTLYFEEYVYSYNFIDGNLEWIGIDGDEVICNQDNFIEIFGLIRTEETKIDNGNGFYLRANNCGLYELYLTNKTGDSFESIRIYYSDLLYR